MHWLSGNIWMVASLIFGCGAVFAQFRFTRQSHERAIARLDDRISQLEQRDRISEVRQNTVAPDIKGQIDLLSEMLRRWRD